jgi:hypothetical protein
MRKGWNEVYGVGPYWVLDWLQIGLSRCVPIDILHLQLTGENFSDFQDLQCLSYQISLRLDNRRRDIQVMLRVIESVDIVKGWMKCVESAPIARLIASWSLSSRCVPIDSYCACALTGEDSCDFKDRQCLSSLWLSIGMRWGISVHVLGIQDCSRIGLSSRFVLIDSYSAFAGGFLCDFKDFHCSA